MRVIVICLAAMVAMLAAGVPSSDAQQKRRATWCFTPDPPGNPPECLYYSFEQCQATASGIGGSCDPNYPASAWGRQYQPEPPRQPQRQQRRDRDWRW